jgi:hypothetical protein
MKTFDPYNFDYKSYVKETYDLNEMPNKWQHDKFNLDDPILNSSEAVWVEREVKKFTIVSLGQSTKYRLFHKIEGKEETYYLMTVDKPFIHAEYAFIRIKSPIKGIENKYLWNFKWDKGLIRNFFNEFIVIKEPVVISDEIQTERGFNFWKWLYVDYVKNKKSHMMYVLDMKTGNKGKLDSADSMERYYTETKSGNLRFVLQKI